MAIADREADASYRAPRASLQISDFDIIGRIGDGAFSTVILARLHGKEEHYAIKIVNKHLVLRNKMADYVRNERNILDQLSDDSIVKLLFTFQDQDSLYFGCEYCPGGDLYEQIQQRGKLSLEDARFYAAEIVQMLEYLRSKQVVHRDLKPENLLLTADGHLKLTDFGSAKAFFLPPTGGMGKQARATSFVGTAEYVSPEVLNNAPLSYPADLWALGSLVFQMLTGTPPFKGASEYLTFQKVAEREFEFPDDFPAPARDLVDALLQLDPDKRLGAEDMSDLKGHPFFAGINWDTLRHQQAPSFTAPPGPTPELEGLDWEITSLVRDSSELLAASSQGPYQDAATMGIGPYTQPGAPPQVSLPPAGTVDAAGEQEGARSGPPPVGLVGHELTSIPEVSPAPSGSLQQGAEVSQEAAGGGGEGGVAGGRRDVGRQVDDDWSNVGTEQPQVVYMRNPDAADSESSDDDGNEGR